MTLFIRDEGDSMSRLRNHMRTQLRNLLRTLPLTLLLGLAFLASIGSADGGVEDCTVKQKLTAIKSVKSNGDGTVTIIHSDGIGSFSISDLETDFLKSWGLET